MLIRFSPHGDMLPRTRKTTRKSVGPIGVPRHQLAPRHEDSSSGSNDPIGDLEAQVEQLRSELRHRNNIWVADGERINELRTDIRHMQHQLAERDLALDWAVNSRSLAWAKEAKARARMEELSSAVDNLQVIVIHYMRKFMYCIHNCTLTSLRILSGWEPDHLEQRVKPLEGNWTFSGPLLQ
jgi:hypothetical protein